jgi:8-oxo-dGTP pyrophosphatase MutT (NUDIX family)
MPDRPSPFTLWQEAGGDGERYRALMREHGHILRPGDEGYEDGARELPCGWNPGHADPDPCADTDEAAIRELLERHGYDPDDVRRPRLRAGRRSG